MSQSSPYLVILASAAFLIACPEQDTSSSADYQLLRDGAEDRMLVMLADPIAGEIYETLSDELIKDLPEEETGLWLKVGRNISCSRTVEQEDGAPRHYCSQIIDRRGGTSQSTSFQPGLSRQIEPIYELRYEGELAAELMTFIDSSREIVNDEGRTVIGSGLRCKETYGTDEIVCSQEVLSAGRTRPDGFDPIVRVGNSGLVNEYQAIPFGSDRGALALGFDFDGGAE
ncbi:hypothetical protein [Pseudobacteriovorax antillogorgiicola]|uniref:Uncharacterized protein n=1 Tax=Pseudobacteriovorax antillogorgiicola TaxID=1513793 RepID=A0A1Y6BUC4_9BACT|nr:hypothetical protein [Pseudobacteriovorax antillogorgiicola]TCS52957.1 hypothetical protein EDD56_1088 [Pseudobacteriovorax antillogorgiicola]SMF27541.1 hypothetical protein SAMN06296036_108239 [Pseudobacteriovorax antillogorgiicola]